MERILLGIQESNKQLQSIRVTIENEKYVQKIGLYFMISSDYDLLAKSPNI